MKGRGGGGGKKRDAGQGFKGISPYTPAGPGFNTPLHYAYLQTFRRFKFLFFGLDQDMATTWPYNWSPELILGAFRTIFEPGPFEEVLGPTLAKHQPKTAKN